MWPETNRYIRVGLAVICLLYMIAFRFWHGICRMIGKVNELNK